MELTSIQISRKLRNKLANKKYQLNFKSIDEVIQKMYDMMNKLKLWDELKGVKK